MKPSPFTIGIVVAALIVIGGIFWYSSSSEEGPPISTFSEPGAPGNQFLELTRKLKSVKFPDTVFRNPRFEALIDITTPIMQEATGRTDPFAPIVGNTPSA